MGFSTSYHPQSNGQSEVVNKSLENYLGCSLEINYKRLALVASLGQVVVQHQPTCFYKTDPIRGLMRILTPSHSQLYSWNIQSRINRKSTSNKRSDSTDFEAQPPQSTKSDEEASRTKEKGTRE